MGFFEALNNVAHRVAEDMRNNPEKYERLRERAEENKMIRELKKDEKDLKKMCKKLDKWD